ncbi:hypothetical protein E3P86_01988 [Wallemia ichthyophaga]|uniref:Adenylate cyclase n=1 Tax=Wallemia ichthyophaga TaxID=245174 RepID=A0A4T0J5D1_WALIC|nr:hypothetical protein E3P86_01988 [Wallemia ichthyophaga]
MSNESTPTSKLLVAVFNSVIEVIVLCLCGYFLATRKIIDKPATRLLNKLNIDLFTPALLFSKVAFSLSPSKLRELHVIPIGFVLITLASVLAAWGLGRLVGLNKRQRNFAIACGAFQNSNSLPIALMQSLVVTVPSLKWSVHDTKEMMLGRALTYLVVYSTMGQVLRWSWGVRLLAEADQADEPNEQLENNRSFDGSEEATVYNDNSATPYNDNSATESDPALAFAQNSHFPSSGRHPSITLSPSTPSTSVPPAISYGNDHKLSTGLPHAQIPPQTSQFQQDDSSSSDTDDDDSLGDREWGLPSGTGKMSTIKRLWKKCERRVKPITRVIGVAWRKILSFMTPPLWAAFVSLVIALIRPLQNALDKATPLRGAIKSAGNVSVPLTLVVLGAYFYSSAPESKPTTIQAPVDQLEGDLQRRRPSFVNSVQSFFTNGVVNITKPRTRTSMDKRGEKRTVFVAVVARMIITPAMILPLFLWDDLTSKHRVLDDPVKGSTASKEDKQAQQPQQPAQPLEDSDNPVAPWLSSNLVQSNLNMNYLPPDTPPINKAINLNSSTADLSDKADIDNHRSSAEHKRKGWKNLLKPKHSTSSVLSKDYADHHSHTPYTPNDSPALSRAASYADIQKDPHPSSSKTPRNKPRLGSSHGKQDERPGEPAISLDTDLTHMEGIVAGVKDPQPNPKREKRQGSASTAGHSSNSSNRNASSNSSTRGRSRSRRSSTAHKNQPPMTLPTPSFLIDGQFDLDLLPRSKRPGAQKLSYSTSPRTQDPPQLAPSLSMSPPTPAKEKQRSGSNDRGDSKFPADSKWRINPPPSEFDIPKKMGGKRSGPPSPRQPDHVQLGGIKTAFNQTQPQPVANSADNSSPAGWQAPESWGIVQAPSSKEEYDSGSSEEDEQGDGYYDDNDDNHQRRVSNYFDFNPEEDNWNGAFGEAATWGSPAFQRSSADQNAGVRPIRLKPLDQNNPSTTDVNEYVDEESRKNSDTGNNGTRSRQQSKDSGGQTNNLTPNHTGEQIEIGEDIRKASLRRASSAKRPTSSSLQRPSTAGSASQQGSKGAAGNYCIRVYKSDGSYLTFSSALHTTVNELSHMIAKKLRVQPAMHQLYIREKMKERAMGSSEKPLLLQKRRLEQLGFTDNDHLDELGKEDLSFICRFIYRIATVTYYEAEDVGSFGSFEYIDLQAKNLQTVPIFLYRHAHSIIYLNLSKNPLTDLPSDFIQLCTSLRELKLSMVSMKRLWPSVRLYCRSLTRLDMSCNRMPELDHIDFKCLPKLRSLKVQNNRLTQLPESLSELKHLKYLNISNNKFDVFPRVVCKLTGLDDLDASFNTFQTLPEEISELKEIHRAVFVGNQLAVLPKSAANLISLRELDIRRNALTDISVVCDLPNLEVLLADFNHIGVLDVTIGPNANRFKSPNNPLTSFSLSTADNNPAHITRLDLSNAKLAMISDDAFRYLPNLLHLSLDYNQFTTLPGAIGELSKLEILSCTNNLLSALPESISDLFNLRTLSLHNNNLKTISTAIWQCQNLEVLNVSSNLLDDFPDPPLHHDATSAPNLAAAAAAANAMSHQSSTSDLNSRGGSASSALTTSESDRKTSASSAAPQIGTPGTPQSRPALPLVSKLQRLLIADNRLTDEVFDPISLMTELRVLNLSFNEIDEIPPHRLGKNSGLQELYLSGNNLRNLPSEDLERLIALRILHVNSNKIQVLPAELGKIAKLHVLDVGSNVLKYNIANWGYDWNWNWNLDLRYLNFSGNKRLEIREVKDFDNRNSTPAGRLNLAEFSSLKELRVLGLMDVTLRVPSLPDETENRRVRTSFSNINNMAYGIADSIGNSENLSMSDFAVPRFRGKENECLFGFFDGKISTTANGCHLSKFLHDSFESQLIKELSRLGPGDDTPDALRRAFLRLNKKFFDTALPNLVGVRRKTSNVSDVVPLSSLVSKSSKSDSRKASQVSANSVMAVVSTPTGTAKDAPEMGMFEVKSGAAAVVVYIVGKTMHVANAGDSLAVISRSGSPRVVSTKHEPLSRPETARIRAAEGWVTPGGKVNDELDVSKSFGFYHLQPAVNARPAVHTINLTDMDEFVIVANKSLWDYMSYQTAVDIARTTRDDVMTAAQKLRDFAIAYGAQGNLMVMVVSVADIFRPNKLPSTDENNNEIDNYYGGMRRTGQRKRDDAVVGDRTLARLDREVSPPVGHVTLVFTDIRNSTILWESNRGMQSAMRIHNHLLRRHLRTIGGYEVKTEGDAFMVSFQTVTSALLWCFTVQLQLLTQDWPKEILETDEGRPLVDFNGNSIARGLSVRMGIHVGYPVCEADPVTQRMDYWGPVVNRASRVAAAAEGGQIMASGDVVKTGMSSKVKSEVAALRRIGFGVSTVGERRLKGLEVPEHLSLLYPIQLKGRLQLDKNSVTIPGSREETNTSMFESTPPIINPDDIRKLARVVVKIESLAGGRVHKEPSELMEKDGEEENDKDDGEQRTKHYVQLDTDLEDESDSKSSKSGKENDDDASTMTGGTETEKGMSRASSRTKSKKEDKEEVFEDSSQSVYSIVPSNLLAPVIQDGASDEELVSILEALVSRLNNAINTMNFQRVRMTLEGSEDKDKATVTDPALAAEINFGSNPRSRDVTRPPPAGAQNSSSQSTTTAQTAQSEQDTNQSNHKTLMTNILNSFRRSSSHGHSSTASAGGSASGSATASGARAGIRRQLSKRRTPGPATTSSSNQSESEVDDKDTIRHRLRLLPHLENSRSPNFSITTRQLKPGARLRVGRFTDKHDEGASLGVAEDDKKLMGGGGDPLSLSLAFRSKVVSRNHAEISVNDDGKFYVKDSGSSSGTFLNHRRLSGSTHASKPYEMVDGDIIQLGVDYQGGKDALYRCIKIRVEIGDKMKSPVAFHEKALEQVKEMSGSMRAASESKSNTDNTTNTNTNTNTNTSSETTHNTLDCAICLFPVGICQALFIAPCSHTFHYKCLRGLLNTHYPCFSCPVCRAFADLEEDVEEESEGPERIDMKRRDTKVEDMSGTPANDIPIPRLNGVIGGVQEEEEEEDLTLGLSGFRFNQLDDPLKLRAAASNNLQSDSSSLSSDSSNLNDQSSSEQHQPVQSDHHSNHVQSTDSQSSSITSNSSQLSAHTKAVNLTHRLDTSRTLDIFSMQQKKCKLQIQPSFLPFKRGLVKSADVVLSFTPSTAPQSTEEIIMRRAHIFLLSDLFLVAERMTQSEKESEISAPNTDMWLSFPPLSGKFLKAFKNKQDNAFDLSIMKKETLTIKVESEIARDEWIDDIGNCTNFAFNGPVNKPPNRQSDESSQLPQAHIPPLINSPHTSPPITSPNIFPNNSPPNFPHPPPRDTFPAFDNVPMMGLRQVGSNGAFAPPPPHSIDHQINQLSAANLSNMHLGPRPAQIRPISPGMIPPPPPPFNKLAPRSDGNQPAHAVLSERIPSVDTLQTESSKSLSHDVSGKFTMPSNLIGDIKSGKNKTDSYSPPQSPELDTKALKPEKVRLSAQMRCKVFLKHGHQAWKSLGSGGLKLYTESPSNSKQLVVESDKAKSLLISNYVLLDAVERVGKTGLAVEMSDNGKRTGIIYLIQLKSESSAKGLFDELVRNSSRDVR